MKTKMPAIEIERQEVLIRDGLDCIPCRDPRIGRCKTCRLLSPTLNPVVYFKLDKLRTNDAFRLHLGHLHGKRHENNRDMCAQCPCHNIGMTKLIREVCLEYTAGLPEQGSARFEEALERRPAEKEARKAKRKAKTKAARKAQKARLEKRFTSAAGTVTKSPGSLHQATEKASTSRFSKKKERQKARAEEDIKVSYSSLPAKIREQNARKNYNASRP